jgi:hypothetical protein
MVFCVEVLGWGIMAVLAAKSLYNIWRFIYAVYIANALGHNLTANIKHYGPWAGKSASRSSDLTRLYR